MDSAGIATFITKSGKRNRGLLIQNFLIRKIYKSARISSPCRLVMWAINQIKNVEYLGGVGVRNIKIERYHKKFRRRLRNWEIKC